MPPKGASASGNAKGSKKAAKPVFDPFERVCTYTSVPLRDPATLDASRSPAAAAAVAAAAAGEGEGNKVGEFTASELLFVPPLPRTEVSLTLRIRVSVSLSEGDVIYVHLPKFGGPAAQQFGLQGVSSAADTGASGAGGGGGGDAVNTATCFRAFWSGTTPKVTSAVRLMEFKRGKKGGAPPKQVVMLQCVRDVPADTLLVFGIPRALGIVTPDKLPANSSKLKLEGPEVFLAEGHRILKQVIQASSEIRKQTVVEELAVYEHSIAQVVREGGLQAEDRHLSEQLSLEEIDQLWQAAQYRRRYPVPLSWSVAQEVAVAYEEAGGFVKRIVQNAIACIKAFDPLALHKEVARNWGVKPAAVVMLDDLLSAQWTGHYPGLPRASLFAACLLTMEPEDVGRAFLSVPQLPPRSIAEELMSAFRMRAGLEPASSTVSGVGGDAAEAVLEAAQTQPRCAAVLDRWAALLTALLPASFVAEAPQRMSYGGGGESAALNGGDGDQGLFANGRARQNSHRHSNASVGSAGGGGAVVATLRPPPTLYLGFRDVPLDAQRALRALKKGDWFLLPFQAVARQSLPYAAVTPSSMAAAGGDDYGRATPAHGERDSPARPATGNEDEDDENVPEEEPDSAAAAFIPDNAVVVELRRTVEALELADVSFSPYNRAWLLPLATSCRVIAVEEDQHGVLHVVVRMEGSLVGHRNDAFLPQNDRSVATVILSKYLMKAEQSEFYVSAFSQLTALYARRNERRRLHPPTLIRAQYLSHYNAAMRASAAKFNVEETERVEWQVRTHDAQLLEEGVVKPAVWEPIQRKYMVTVEQFFLGHSRTLRTLEEGNLSVDLNAYTIDYGGKGPRALRRVVEKVTVTHEALPAETLPILEEREETYGKQLLTLDSKLGISPSTATGAGDTAKRASAAGSKKKKG